MRLRFFLSSQPDISEGWGATLGPRSSRATKKVRRLEVWIEKELSIHLFIVSRKYRFSEPFSSCSLLFMGKNRRNEDIAKNVSA